MLQAIQIIGTPPLEAGSVNLNNLCYAKALADLIHLPSRHLLFRRSMRGSHWPFLSTLVLLVSLGSYAHAQEVAASSAPQQNITARAGEHPEFDRVVFDWPRTTAYNVTRDGNRVTVHFGSNAHIQFNGFSFLTRAKGFTTSSSSDGGMTVSFTVSPDASLHDFTTGNSVAIDIQGGVAKTAPAAAVARTQAAPVAALPSPVAQLALAQAAPPPVAASAPKAAPPQEVPKTDAAAKVDVSKADTTKTDTVKTAMTALPPAPITPPAIVPLATTAPIGSTITLGSAASLGSSAPLGSSIPEISSPSMARPQNAVTGPSYTGGVVKLPPAPEIDIGDTPTPVATLDPKISTRAAVWQRAGYGYIIFDRKLTLSLDVLTKDQVAPRVALEALDLDKASGFRFRIPDDTDIHAARDGSAWKILLAHRQPDIPVSISLVAQPDFALGARYLLPLPDSPDPIRFIDPIVGDNLYLVPLTQTEAFSVVRRMSDFIIVPAAQGLVIKPLTDKMIIRAVSDGIEVTNEGGSRMSSATDTGASQQSTQQARAAAMGKSLFDFAGWRGKPNETFTQTRQRVQQTIVDVPERERNRARLDLARFYFAHGNGEEALAMMNWLASQVPDLRAHADFSALEGAAHILAYHPEDGLKDLDTPLFNGQPEIELWRAIGEAEERDWSNAEEKFSVTENILSGYPEPFHSRFTVLAIESALAAGKEREAAEWLDQFENGQHEDSADAAIAYLHGVIHAKAGRAASAESSWKEAAGMSDRLYKVRAEMALIDLSVANGTHTPAQAADRLEALRFAWRGDDLEVDILHRLGEFYVQAHNVKSGLAVLASITQLYPSSPMTPAIRDEMSHIFHDVFLGDLGKKMSPLDSLTLYQQYRNLMPTGADGIATTQNLAERLVAIDLLEQAGDLLEDLVKNKLSGEEKGHVSARLAAIRLLDHKPDAALAALDYSNGEFFPPDLQNERQLLRAKALADLGRNDDALALLHDNNRESAKLLRADITMHAQHWTDAAKALMDLIGAPPKPGEQLSNDQADWLVNCAVALSLAGDQVGLDKLAIDYGAAMSGTPENDTFRVLTQPEKTGQLKDITAAQSRIADVNMFQGFLNSYRQSTATDAPPAPQK